MGLSDKQQAVLMAIAFALAGVGTIALPTSWPWELRIVPALIAAVFAGVKEFLGGAAPEEAERQMAAVLNTEAPDSYMHEGYTPTGDVVRVGANTYLLFEKGTKAH